VCDAQQVGKEREGRRGREVGREGGREGGGEGSRYGNFVLSLVIYVRVRVEGRSRAERVLPRAVRLLNMCPSLPSSLPPSLPASLPPFLFVLSGTSSIPVPLASSHPTRISRPSGWLLRNDPGG